MMVEPGQGEEPRAEEWTYIGRRTGTSGKILHGWLDAEGEPRHYANLPGRIIGGVFTVWVDPESTSVYYKGKYAPSYLRRADVDAEERARWVAEDAAAGAERDRKASITKASKAGPLDDVLGPLKAATVKMTRNERRAFALWLFQELGI